MLFRQASHDSKGMHVGPVMTSISEMAKVDLCSSDSKIVTVDQMASEACHYSGSEISSYLQLVYNELWNTLGFTVCIKRPAYSAHMVTMELGRE